MKGRKAAFMGWLSIGLALAGPVRAAMPTLGGLQPLALHHAVNRVAAVASDGRPATVVMAQSANGNTHGDDVLLVSMDGADGNCELDEFDRPDGESPDRVRIEPFDEENAILAVRFARGRVGDAPAMLRCCTTGRGPNQHVFDALLKQVETGEPRRRFAVTGHGRPDIAVHGGRRVLCALRLHRAARRGAALAR